jgi:MFS family permease
MCGLLALALSVPAGHAAKRCGEKRVLVMALLLVGFGLFTLGRAPGFLTAFAARALWIGAYRFAFVSILTAIALTSPPSLKGASMGFLGSVASQKRVLQLFMPFIAGCTAALLWAQTPSTIRFGCAIDAQEQILESRALAKCIASPIDPQWRAKGDLHRKYHFAAANADMPYRLYIPISWDSIRKMPILMTEGTGAAPSLAGSRAMSAWMKERGFKLEYLEVNADHGGMVPLVLPSMFNFFDRYRSK